MLKLSTVIVSKLMFPKGQKGLLTNTQLKLQKSWKRLFALLKMEAK